MSVGGEQLTSPLGVDQALMRQLAAELARVLAAQPKQASARITDYFTPARQLDGADAVLTWKYLSPGDYNQDGLVNLADLAPLGIHFGHTQADPNWGLHAVADGNGDGSTSISDVAPIGIHWHAQLQRYLIESADVPTGPWSPAGEVSRTAGLLPPGGGLRNYVFRVVGGAATPYFRAYGDGETRGDPWLLWSGGAQLRGANLWQARVIQSIYGDTLGTGAYGPPVTQADLDALASLGANYVNISHPGLYAVTPPYQFDPQAQANLDSLLAMVAQADMFAVITFRTGPGRSEFTFNREEVGTWFPPEELIETVWTNPQQQAAWADMWRYAAQRYGGNPVVAAFDIMCEPNSPDVVLGLDDPADYYPTYSGAVHDWNAIYPPIVSAIRTVNSMTPIIVACSGWSDVRWLPYLAPTGDDRIVYSVHQYSPHGYTHQTDPALPVHYPGQIDLNGDGVPDTFDLSALDTILDPVEQFKVLHPAPVCCNEYGPMRYEPGAATFITDLTGLFDSHNLNNAIWEWSPSYISSNPAIDWDDFNFRHGPLRGNHIDVLPNSLSTVLQTYWSGNSVRPSNFGSPPQPATRLQRLHAAKHFMYQIQQLDSPGAVATLAATHYDAVVVEPTVNTKGSEGFDLAGMVSSLKASANSQGGQKLVIAYVDIGEAEDYRTYWQADWIAPTVAQRGVPDFLITLDPDGWSGNYPVAYWDPRWQAIIVDKTDSLLRMVLNAGFDGIYLDWVEAYDDPSVAQAAADAGLDPAAQMGAFISHIRSVAKLTDPEFLVIQQNAPYLMQDAAGLAQMIDGLAQEDTWFLGEADVPWGDTRGGDIPQDTAGDSSTAALIALCQQYQAAGLTVWTVDYCLSPAHASQVYSDSQALGFVPLVSQTSLSQSTTIPPPWY